MITNILKLIKLSNINLMIIMDVLMMLNSYNLKKLFL